MRCHPRQWLWRYRRTASQGWAGTSATGAASSSGAGTSQTSDTCSLLTQSDAETALGEPAGSPTPRQTATSSAGTYISSSGSARLDVDISRWRDSATAASKFQEFRKIGQPVSGLGDRARGNTGILAVLKGSVLVNISMPVAPKQPDPAGAMRTLASRLLGQL